MYKFQTKKLAAKTGSKVDLGKERNQKVGLHLMRYDLSYAKVMSCFGKSHIFSEYEVGRFKNVIERYSHQSLAIFGT